MTPELPRGGGPAGALAPTPQTGQRTRLIDAITRAGAECGYAELDAGQIALYAGLPVEEFHRHFHSTEQCLLAAYDSYLERLGAHIEAACEAQAQWPERIAASVDAGLEFVCELGGVSRLFAVDAMCAGLASLERRFCAIERGAALLRGGRDLYPRAADLPDSLELSLIAGVATLVSVPLLAEQEPGRERLRPQIVELLLSPYLGTAGARALAARGATASP